MSSIRIEEAWSSSNWEEIVSYWNYCRDNCENLVETALLLLDGQGLKLITNWQTYIDHKLTDDVELLWQMVKDIDCSRSNN